MQTGTLLKALRDSRGLSLDGAATICGVSKAMLGQIERHESSPTVATLWKIATSFGVPMSSLLEPTVPADSPVTARRSARVKLSGDAGGPWKPLFRFDPATGLEVFVIEMAAGTTSLSPAHSPGVREHIIVVAGNMEVLVGGKWRRLSQGAGLRFDADKPHGYRNKGCHACVFHNIIHYA